jgi:hypothetical protein
VCFLINFHISLAITFINWKHSTYLLQIQTHCYKADHITAYSQRFLLGFKVSVAMEITTVGASNHLQDIQSHNPNHNLKLISVFHYILSKQKKEMFPDNM